MSLDEGISRFIGRLYEAVYDADAWHSAIRDLMQRTGSRIAFISSLDLREREFSRSHFHAPEESCVDDGIREYTEETYATDPSLVWASEHPFAGMCETEAIIPRSEYLDHPFIKWNRSRFGTTHWRVMYTQPADDFSLSLSLHPPADTGPPPKHLRPLHRLVFDHMERALRLAARPPDFSRDGGAVLALDRHGRIVAMSSRAEQLLAADDGLRSDSRRLLASDPDSALRLQSAIAASVCIDSSTTAPRGGVRIRRRSGRADWLALTSPYPAFLEHLLIPAPAAFVRIVETDAHSPLNDEHGRLFDLTGREIEIASALLEGHSLESLAVRLGISRNTAKVHLQALFRKTSTNRQADLVRVLTEISHR